MTITIEAEPKEIVALVVAIQEQQKCKDEQVLKDKYVLEVINRLQDAIDQNRVIFQL